MTPDQFFDEAEAFAKRHGTRAWRGVMSDCGVNSLDEAFAAADLVLDMMRQYEASVQPTPD